MLLISTQVLPPIIELLINEHSFESERNAPREFLYRIVLPLKLMWLESIKNTPYWPIPLPEVILLLLILQRLERSSRIPVPPLNQQSVIDEFVISYPLTPIPPVSPKVHSVIHALDTLCNDTAASSSQRYSWVSVYSSKLKEQKSSFVFFFYL